MIQEKNFRFTIRVSEKLHNFVKSNAELVGVTPSEFIRMMLHSSMVIDEMAQNKVKEGLKKVTERENAKANFNNNL